MPLGEAFLSDRLGPSFSVICFSEELKEQLAELLPADEALCVMCLPFPCAISDKLGAGNKTAYLIRPDMHIAARWKETGAETIFNALMAVTFTKSTGQ
ncbi:MAG: hypothetical protein ACRBCL_16140 [Maritimibacter sp.]